MNRIASPFESTTREPLRPGAGLTRLGLVAVALLVAVAAAVPPAAAQTVLPPATQLQSVFSADFASSIDSSVWTATPSGTGNWYIRSDPPWCFGGGHWDNYLAEDGARSPSPTLLEVNQSMPGNPGYNPLSWTNIRAEFDLHTGSTSQMGFMWGLQPDTNGDGYPDAGYLFYVSNFADSSGAVGSPNRAIWYLIRRESDINTVVGQGEVVLEAGVSGLDSMYSGRCYRMRIDFYCGNLRVQVRSERFNSSSCLNGCYAGCGYDGSDPETAWCTIVEWTDPNPVLTPGGVALWHGSPSSGWVSRGRWDNLDIWSWGPDCSICDAWSAWGTGWPTGNQTATDHIPFKVLFDYVAADTTLLSFDGSFKGTDQLCGQWDLLVDLPPPGSPSGSSATDVQHYLEPVASAKTPHTGAGGDWLTYGDDFTTPPPTPPTNPIPLMYWGQTPIDQTLQSAYQWYKTTRGVGGAWDDQNDPLAACRNWYIIFITDGEESCDISADGTPAVCHWLSENESFANPGTGLERVPIYTIGFSQNVAANSPLRCMSDLTSGTFSTAANASELADALSNVILHIPEDPATFAPVTVSPPPSTIGGAYSTDFLMTIPLFVPKNQTSIWEGHLYAFQINPNNPTPPLKPVYDQNGNITGYVLDTNQAKWDGESNVAAQIGGSPGRNLFFARQDGSGVWNQRTPLDQIKTNSTYLADFKVWSGKAGASDNDGQQVINFAEGHDATFDNGTTASRGPLGDIFHSQPVAVSPPNDFRYLINDVHGYTSFAQFEQYRRRVVLAGSNDGLLHAFDGGFFNRDTTNWPNAFDLGNGTELFAVVPHAVIGDLWSMASNPVQRYMVDGNIGVGDVYIDPDGNGDQWRTIAVASMRRGGRGVTALDVTQPDPVPSGGGVPTQAALPGCTTSTTGCKGDYPSVLWEFTSDQDTDDDANGVNDLGWTWSTPLVTRVKWYGGTASNPNDKFMVFFGGGWDGGQGDRGNYFYGLDAATGQVIYKVNIGSAVPGAPAALDTNDDGFVDRIYFGDTNGGLWRLDLTTDPTMGGPATDWQLTRIYSFGPVTVTLADGTTVTRPLMFFQKPKLVPVLYSGGGYVWGLAIGTGDRSNIGALDGVRNRFYFVLDNNQASALTESDLQQVDVLTDGNVTPPTTSYFDPSNGLYGWYLLLRENEKVNTDAIVANEIVQFPTFEGTGIGATGGGGSGEPATCQSEGTSRLYRVNYINANGVDGDRSHDEGGFITGQTGYTVGGTTISYVSKEDTSGTKYEFGGAPFHRITNWRQE